MIANAIKVRTHVARDLLQSAMLFKTDKLVVWEYVANGLQYREPGVLPIVNVTLDPANKQIIVDDNGSGMDREGLQNFFVMHGENKARKAGKAGRGRFGTGKSAAFGIANKLRVSSIHNRKRNTVELSRSDIEAAGDGDIMVHTVEKDVPTKEPNGTVVTISKLNLRKLDQRGIINFIERHLAHWPNKPMVRVNTHVCEYSEPAVSQSRIARPKGDALKVLGDVELTLKVAKSPLDVETQGVAIHTNGVWLESTLAGAEGQPMAQYIFGHIDVPALDDESAPIPAFDMSRSMKLNPNNDAVHHLFAFVGLEVDRLRRELVQAEKEHRAQEDTKKLQREARKIAEIINRDFQDFSDRIARVKAKSGTGHDLGANTGNSGEEPSSELVLGGDINAVVEEGVGSTERGEGEGGNGSELPESGQVLKADDNGTLQARSVSSNGTAKRRRGGFSVEFKEMGQESARANYVSSERTIYVNLEHPQISAAKGDGDVNDLTLPKDCGRGLGVN